MNVRGAHVHEWRGHSAASDRKQNAWCVPIYDIERGFWHAGHPCGLRTVYTAGALGRCIRRAACWRGRLPLGQGRRATGELPASPALPLASHWPVSPRRARRLRPQHTISSHCPALSPKPSTDRTRPPSAPAYRAPSTLSQAWGKLQRRHVLIQRAVYSDGNITARAPPPGPARCAPSRPGTA